MSSDEEMDNIVDDEQKGAVYSGNEQDIIIDGAGEELAVDGEEDGELVPPRDDSTSRLSAHSKDVFCLAVSPNGKWMVSGSEDNSVTVWDLGANSCDPYLKITGQHTDSVHCLAWNAAGNMFASADMLGRILCTSIPADGKEPPLIIEDCMDSAASSSHQRAQKGDEEECESFEQLCWIFWHPTANGILFAGCGDGSIWMWLITRSGENASVHQSKVFTTNSTAPCVAGKLLADTRHLIGAYESGVARVWDLKEAKSVEVALPGPCSGAIDVNAELNLAAIGCKNGLTVLMSASPNPKLLHIFASPKEENAAKEGDDDSANSVETVRFAPQGLPWLAVGTTGGHLSIFDWEQRSSRYECEHDGEAVVSCLWRLLAPNNDVLLISACIDSGVRIWNAKNGEPLSLLSGGGDEIYDMRIAQHDSEGVLIFTACSNGLIRVFKLPENV